MTLYPRDHQRAVDTLTDAVRDLDALHQDTLPHVSFALFVNDQESTKTARTLIREALTHVAHAMGALDQAKKHLPLPATPERTNA